MIFGIAKRCIGYFSAELGSTGRLAAGLFGAAIFAAVLAPMTAQAQETAPAPTAVDTAGPTTEELARIQRINLRDNPISPPDTTSPRATLESFLFIMREASQLWVEVRDAFNDSNAAFLTAEQKKQMVLVRALLDKASETFDLSEIPITARSRASIEISLQMQEILDRVHLPDFNSVPGWNAGIFAVSDMTADTKLPEHWMIPGTNINIIRQASGERKNHYLFSRETVGRIPADYAIIHTLPVKADRGEDLFDYYIYTPGNLIAPRWYKLIKAGPAWLQNRFGDQTCWQWLAFGILSLVYLFAFVGYSRWRRWRAVSTNEAVRTLGKVVPPVTVILAAIAFRYLCEEQINITGVLLGGISTVTTAVVWTSVAWLTYRFMGLIYVWGVKKPGVSSTSLDASLMRTAFRAASLAISMVVVGYGATRIGIPIYGVIAGLGVGGLAIALAAQPTIENIIGGVILYADRMVRVGEYCQFDELAGTVESIGIRSTRIRALDRTLITISNADLAKRKIINYSRRDQFHFRHKLGLRYETPSEKVRDIAEAIRACLEQHEKVLEAPLRVRLIGYDDYAVAIDVYAYVQTPDLNEFLAIQEELLIEIRHIITARGSDFAYPSSTVYLSRDGGLPAASPQPAAG